ncbi:hypothetical protein BHE74_00043018 [Ensete ventricosum]|nr:hypothetical protein BHE74_00043018 [Ensete ventricosum]RZR98461.1 hypothetical protein BHM03_00027808 [Ensete ventricosum]
MSQERQELLGNSREPPGEGTHIPNLSLTLGDLFLLSTLEAYDESKDPTEHVVAFRAHMALYDTSNTLMCWVFPTTLRGLAQMCSRFFWSLIKRPPVTIPEMLQQTIRRWPNRPELSYPRPPPPPLNSTWMEIFLQIKEKGLLRTPNPLKGPRELQDQAKYYRLYRDYNHDMEDYHDLLNHIEELIHRGYLECYI